MRKQKQNLAQTFVEYSILLGIAIAGIVAMAVFVQRGLQGRIFEAKKYMTQTVSCAVQETGAEGRFSVEYEPYYVDTNSSVVQDSEDETHHNKGGDSEGIYHRDFSEGLIVQMNSYQLPPGMGQDFE